MCSQRRTLRLQLKASCAYLNAEILGDSGGLSSSGAKWADRIGLSIALSVCKDVTISLLSPLCLNPQQGLLSSSFPG